MTSPVDCTGTNGRRGQPDVERGVSYNNGCFHCWSILLLARFLLLHFSKSMTFDLASVCYGITRQSSLLNKLGSILPFSYGNYFVFMSSFFGMYGIKIMYSPMLCQIKQSRTVLHKVNSYLRPDFIRHTLQLYTIVHS
ncbi:hypothetical protein BRADI_2g48428v3 [Brachypodium distachyon]|uniref:Uncharacterized protein n=1 Tax=Brachypodium distachyon TaxID=15368 RepID=A0A2K2DEL6_BRADI|nr:hypothetical protein BRADI_2g48428v3 [Brachypodium distachyon]